MGIQDSGRAAVVGAAALVSSLATPAEAMVVNSSMTDAAKDAGISLIQSMGDASEESAAAIREGEDAADSDAVPEPESAEHSDPPEGVDVGSFTSAWTDADAAEVISDPTAFDGLAAAADPDLGDLGGVF